MSDLPPGFVLDQPNQPQQIPGLPPGFVLDQPMAASGPQKPAPIHNVSEFMSALGDTTIGRMVKGAYGAVTLPGDVYTGKTAVDVNNPEFMGRVTDLAGLASPMAPRATSEAALNATKGAPTTEALRSAADQGYEKARSLGVDINPTSVANLAEGLTADLTREGFDAKLAEGTHRVLNELRNPPPGSVATIANLETVRRTLGNVARNYTNPTDQAAASRAIKSLDDYLAGLGPSDVVAGDATGAAKILSDARGNYAAAKKSEQITGAAEAADLSAAAANSGRNIGNANRQKFKSILLSDKQSAGFSPDELGQLERVVRGTRTGNANRYIGNVLGGGGGLGQAVTAALAATGGAAVGGVPGSVAAASAVPIAGNIARALANRSVQKQVGRLDEMVRSNSPLARSLEVPGLTPAQQAQRMAIIRALLLQTPPPNQ